jgi:hypothetical protein
VIYEACCNDGDEIQAADEYLFDDGDVVAHATLAAALHKAHEEFDYKVVEPRRPEYYRRIRKQYDSYEPVLIPEEEFYGYNEWVNANPREQNV